ncbi:hypothetical protein DSM106972_038340 [Dulcicalothrix desertica PCC 7102]|uniref:Cadherin domain-containing protein n=1 Tax=Dulcicalothrix desertica PCC 7102 TaxID=232991 RepID=A0A3S1CL80_9CYAN|nr:VCBS repeat-containing protein [Dulcicalothrix desertica]RUT05013.1 hypothetical protein DSM106972_038340 [Dulcicalothrix desertica PCC 7102]TWH43424.1 Calx-beta domain-containing protein [Dulcicalothrix desertica PCC 7102]
MDSLDLNSLSGTQLTNSPLNTGLPGESQSFISFSASSANIAPILRDTPVTLLPVFEDAAAPVRIVGTPISSIINFSNVTDNGQIGIAITAIGTGSNGTWYFTTDGGKAWAPLGNVSESDARLLLANSNSRIYFQPNADYNGFISNAITFRAWDTTDGTAGSTANVATNGGTTAFSNTTDTASLQVRAVNDAPVNTVPTSTQTSRIGFNEDTEFAFKDNNAIRVADIDAGNGAIDVTVNATSGTLFLSDSIIPNSTNTISISGSLTTINATLDKLVYKPIKDYNGAVNIRVTTTDRGNTGGFARNDEDTIYLNVLRVNDAPTFTKGSNDTIDEDLPLRAITWATNISKGASNESNQTVAFTVTISPEDSQLFQSIPTIDANGVLRYSPKPNTSGTANVTVFLTDNENAESKRESFSITVNPVNDPPVNLIPSQLQTVLEDSVLTFSNARNNIISISDIDAGAGIMQVKVEAPNGILSVATTTDLNVRNNKTGSVTLTGTLEKINAGLDGLQFTPNKDFNGRTLVKMTTNDQGNTGIGPAYTVSNNINIDVIAVNDAPRFTKGDNQVVKEDTPSQSIPWATAISPGAANETGQSLRFNVTNDNNSLFSVQPQISANGILFYTLAKDQNGIANVRVVLEDGGDNSDGGISVSREETFTITVTPVNDGPTNRVPNTQTQTILEDSELVFTDDKLISISDIDAGNNPVQVKVIANNGILTWNDSKTLTTAQGKGTGTVTLTGKLTDINADLNGLTFKPSTNFIGFTAIQVITNDQGSTGDGRAWEVSSNIGVVVNPVNDVPSFTKGSDIPVNEDAGLQQITGWATRVNTGAANESQSLQFNVRNSDNALFAEQPRISVNGSLGTLIFRTAPNANGTAKVFVSLRDTGGTRDNGVDTSAEQEFTINIGTVNDAPINRVPTPQTMDEDDTIVFSALGGINNAITVSDVDVDVEGLTLETKISTENGTLSVTNTSELTSSSSTPGSITLVGTVNAINKALDGLTFTPTANFNGIARIQVETNDQGNTGIGGALTDTDIITVNVNPINDAPTFTKGADVTISEDAERYNKTWATEITTGPLDDNRQRLTFIVTNTDNALFSEQPRISSDGKLTFKSAVNANGEATVTVILQDNGGVLKSGKDTSNPVTFKITVNAVNDAPVNNIPSGVQTITEDALPLALFSVNTGNAITITEVDKEPNATVQINLSSEDGTIKLVSSADFSSNVSLTGALSDINRALDGLTFKPNLNFNGEAKIRLASSKQGMEDVDIIKVNLTPVNDAPTVIPGANLSVSAGASFNIPTWATFSPGPDNESAQQALQYTVTSISDPRLFSTRPSIDRQGNLIFTTARGIKTPTTATIGVRVRDNGGTNLGGVDTSVEKTFEITVNPIQVNITAATEFVEEGNSGTTDYDFDVRLSGASNETVTVQYSTVDETATGADKDYQATSQTVTFRPGETSKTVKVKINGDTKFETDQTFRVNLSELRNVDSGTTTSAIGTIKNDDTKPVISIGDAYSREGKSTLEIPVSLSNASDEQVTVDYIVTDGTATAASGDYTAGASVAVVFASGEISKSISIPVNNDDTFETNETFFVELKDPTNGTISTTSNKATAKIINDDAKNTTDFNNDGYSDIVLRNYRTGENLIWFMNNFTIDKGVIIDRQQDKNWVLEGVADFTTEGKLDFLYRNYKTGENEIWMMDGTQRLQVLPLLTLTDTNWVIKGVQDFNGDRKTDIMWYNAKTSESMIWQMNGPTISRSISLPKVTSTYLNVELVADLSGDGKADIIWRNERTGASTVWVMGDTTVQKQITLEASADANIHIQGAADFNDDGKLDIVASNYLTGENTVWYLDNTANEIKIKTKAILPTNGANMRIEQITDFDNDGNLDFLYRDFSTGENEIWRMKGAERDQIIKLPKLRDNFWEVSV